MKTILLSRRPVILSITFVVAALLTTGLSSCLKNNNDNTTPATLNVINAAESQPSQDLYISGVKINATAIAFTQATGNFSVVGQVNGQLKDSNTSNNDGAFSGFFISGAAYTLFYADDKSVIASNNDPTPALSSASRVRFVNLSTVLTSNIDITYSSTTLVSGLAYQNFSNYYDFDYTKAIAVKTSGSSTVVINIPANTILPGKIYTIYFTGTTTATLAYHVVAES